MADVMLNEDEYLKPEDLALYHTLHNPKPDYDRPILKIPAEARERMLGRLRFLYGDGGAEGWMAELERIMKVYYAHKPQHMIDSEKNFDPGAVYGKGHDAHHLW